MQQIIVASGVEIRDKRQEFDLKKILNARASQGKKANVWTFPSGPVARAQYEVLLVHTMDEFKDALEEDKAWVVYSGHSRYGQGPAFGPAHTPHCPTQASMPVNPWEQHFRMGWDATDTECLGDILKHGVSPVEFDLLSAKADMFLPPALLRAATRAKAAEARKKRKELSAAERKNSCLIGHSWRPLDVCKRDEAEKESARPSKPLKGRNYYAQILVKDDPPTTPPPYPDYLTPVVAGHEHLDKITLRCALLFMASCSSSVHYREALVRHRKKQRSSCWFYLTSRINTASHAAKFVDEVFNGTDPLTVPGSKLMEKALNSQKDPGTVVVVRS